MTDYSGDVHWWMGDLNDDFSHLVDFARVTAKCGKRVTYAWIGPGEPDKEHQCPDCLAAQRRACGR